MSRLIDAEALKKTFCAECDHSISCEDCDIDFHFEHLAPTVEAIPVEWLEKFGVTRYQKNLISNIIGTWREEQSNE